MRVEVLRACKNVLRDNSSFGLAGQIFGDEAESVGFIYWGVGDADSEYVATEGLPVGGAFIASRSGIYPQNLFSLTGVPGGAVDIDGTGGASSYGVGIGTRARTANRSESAVDSEIIIITGDASADVATATNADLVWLTTALEAISSGATADADRADGTGAAQTFTTGYSATGVIEYRTNRTAGSPATALDVVSLYLIDNATADRIAVTGPDYVAASRTFLEGQAGNTLSYAGRITAPRLLADAFGTAHDATHRFTLDIVVASTTSATFDIGHTRTAGGTTSLFNIEGGAVDLASGRLTLGSAATSTVTDTVTATSTTANLYKAGTGTFGLVGQIYGTEAEAVGGAYWGQANKDAASFADGDDGKPFGGAFIASRSGVAPLLAQSLANPDNGLRIGTAREDVSGTSGHGRGSLFLSSSTATFNTHLKALNVASDTVRGNALLANLRDALTGGAPVPDTGISKYTLSSSNKITYGSDEAASGVVFGNSVLGLRLVAVDGFIAAGGTLLTAAISGTFRYSGAFVSASSASLGSALREGTFDLVADLSGAASTHYFTLDAQTVNAGGTVTSQLDVTQANGGTINATSGAFSATAASFIEGAGSTGGIQALVHGRILSDGEGVAGLFTTTRTGGTIYAGGFVGGAPILAQSLANPDNGLRIGTAREDVSGTSGHGRGSLFLSSSETTFDTHLNALNVASDTVRGDALLANLRDALTGGVPVPDTGISKYTLSSSNKITYGSSEATSGVVFGDSALGLRLVAVDGFIAAGGTLLTAAISGTFRYSGAFVSAASGSLGSALREGTFDLVADLSGAANTHYFTLDAQTVNAGGAVTSQLDVTRANGGTINATTGAFSATAASFIEGAGSTGGITQPLSMDAS